METNAETDSDDNGKYIFFFKCVLWSLCKKGYSYHNLERILSASKICEKYVME